MTTLERFLLAKIKVDEASEPCEGIRDATGDAIEGEVEEDKIANVVEEHAKRAVVVVSTVIEHALPTLATHASSVYHSTSSRGRGDAPHGGRCSARPKPASAF